jgi:hypothetical protein
VAWGLDSIAEFDRHVQPSPIQRRTGDQTEHKLRTQSCVSVTAENLVEFRSVRAESLRKTLAITSAHTIHRLLIFCGQEKIVEAICVLFLSEYLELKETIESYWRPLKRLVDVRFAKRMVCRLHHRGLDRKKPENILRIVQTGCVYGACYAGADLRFADDVLCRVLCLHRMTRPQERYAGKHPLKMNSHLASPVGTRPVNS